MTTASSSASSVTASVNMSECQSSVPSRRKVSSTASGEGTRYDGTSYAVTTACQAQSNAIPTANGAP